MKTLQIALAVFLGSFLSLFMIFLALLHTAGNTIELAVERESKEYPKHFTIDGVECIAVNMFSLSCNWNNSQPAQGENNGNN